MSDRGTDAAEPEFVGEKKALDDVGSTEERTARLERELLARQFKIDV